MPPSPSDRLRPPPDRPTAHPPNRRHHQVTYNSLIAACAHGGPWEKAAELFDQMQKEGCKPDGITFAALISAYERGGQWRRGLQALEHMTAQVGWKLVGRGCFTREVHQNVAWGGGGAGCGRSSA